MDSVDVVVVGASQAGLATGYHLHRQGADFRIVDAAPAPGHAWRSRWDSLALFTSRRFGALPGMPVPGDPDSYPGKDAIADYLDAYAQRFHLPIQLDTSVESLARNGSEFVAHTPRDAIAARAVIVATGPFQTPAVPAAISGPLAPSVQQVHSSAYRNPGQLPDGRSLVVGGGNSGFQIALELARAGRDVHLAKGVRNRVLPQRFFRPRPVLVAGPARLHAHQRRQPTGRAPAATRPHHRHPAEHAARGRLPATPPPHRG